MTDASDEKELSFEDCFRDEYPSVVRTLVPIVLDRAEAEAVAQDAFLKALRRWRRIRTLDRPGAWIRRVAIRDAVRNVDRRRRDARLGDTTKAWVRLSTGGAEINLDLERLPNGRLVGWTSLPEPSGVIVAFDAGGNEIDRSAPFDF